MTRFLIQWLRQCLTTKHARPLAPPTVRAWHPPATQNRPAAALHIPPAPLPERTKRHPAVANRTPATRIIEWETAANGGVRTLGRVVMVGKFSEICAELDRLAALEMA